jgi:hypothetical protein
MSPRNAGFPADNPLSYAVIERRASSLRSIVLPQEPLLSPLPGLRIFEGLRKYHVIVAGEKVPLDYDVKAFPPGVEALTLYESQSRKIIVILSESTYELLELNDPRARFSLAHEIGHAILHPAELVRLSHIPHSRAALFRAVLPEHPVYRDTEWQANSFASALLMPAKALVQLEREGRLSSIVIQAQFQVSQQAAVIRLEQYHKRRAQFLQG